MAVIKRYLRLLLMLSFAIAAVIAAMFAVMSRGGTFSPPGELIDEARFQDYHVKVYRRNLEGFREKMFNRLPSILSELSYRVPGLRAWSGAEILKNGRRVFSCYGADLAIAQFGSNVAGTDVTGDGIPNIALTDRYHRWSGGVLFLFECGKTFRKITIIESIGEFPKFCDIDGDGVPEVTASDDAFYHFPAPPRDGRPMPTLILRWRNGRYVAAKDLMGKAAPAKEELEAKAARRRSVSDPEESSDISDEFSATVLDLLYSGHECLAWEFIDAGLDDPLEKEYFITELQSRLEQSVYWPALQ